jgi:hypothetical protein
MVRNTQGGRQAMLQNPSDIIYLSAEGINLFELWQHFNIKVSLLDPDDWSAAQRQHICSFGWEI